MTDLYTFPPAPSPDAIEWPGTPIGAGNCITRTKTRTAVHDKTIDRVEGRRDALVNAAVAHITKRAAHESLYLHDVIIHGIRVRATTNSPHLYDFWVENWYSPEEWRATTGLTPPAEPQVTVYALGGLSDQQEAAFYSRKTNTIVFFNTAYYGQLKSWVLGAVGRVLAEEYGIHSIHGACVAKDGKGVLYIAPTGTGKSTSSYGLMTYPGTRFHSDDWVYVRYTYPTADGRQLHPMRVQMPDGREIKGFRVFRWLESEGARSARAIISGVDLENHEVSVPASALDRGGAIAAYAYTSEKIFYLRTNLVENFPLSALALLRSKMENVPDVTPTFLAQNEKMLGNLVDAIRAEHGTVAEHFAQTSQDELTRLLARLIAFDNARAMLDISHVFPPERMFTNPMEPARLSTVILLKRNRDERAILEHLSLARLTARLLIGETPDKKREIAYNAYRAVDDDEEGRFVATLEGAATQRHGPSYPIDELATLMSRNDIPQTLLEEFELFRVMHRSTQCYELNTILALHPQVRDKKDAVRLTMELIAKVVDEQPTSLTVSLDELQSFLGEPARLVP